jgi:hypothetical protein
MDHRITLSPLLAAARDDLRSRRASRASRRTLECELAGYTTDAEQNELEAILQRADPDAAAEIRSVIGHSHVA